MLPGNCRVFQPTTFRIGAARFAAVLTSHTLLSWLIKVTSRRKYFKKKRKFIRLFWVNKIRQWHLTSHIQISCIQTWISSSKAIIISLSVFQFDLGISVGCGKHPLKP